MANTNFDMVADVIAETERMDTDGTDRARVTYEYLIDLMRMSDEMRDVPVRTLTRQLLRRI